MRGLSALFVVDRPRFRRSTGQRDGLLQAETVSMCQMALGPLTARKWPVTWQDLFGMTDILSAYVSSSIWRLLHEADQAIGAT